MWTIKGEEVIVLGDKTTHGGEVSTACGTVSYKGKRVACVGDQVICPKCSGTHTIISGAPPAFAMGMQIARNGDMVSCGAKLVSGSMTATQADRAPGLPPKMPWEAEDPVDPVNDFEGAIPGRELPMEEYCTYRNILESNQVFKDTMKQMCELTRKNGIEYSCWFVQDPDGTIRAVNMRSGGPLSVEPGKRPPGAIVRCTRIQILLNLPQRITSMPERSR